MLQDLQSVIPSQRLAELSIPLGIVFCDKLQHVQQSEAVLNAHSNLLKNLLRLVPLCPAAKFMAPLSSILVDTVCPHPIRGDNPDKRVIGRDMNRARTSSEILWSSVAWKTLDMALVSDPIFV